MRIIILLALIWLPACGSSGTGPALVVEAFRTLGDLEDAIASADPADADGDSIPDLIEEQLGTDPNNRDSDFDGLDDNYELFGAGYSRGDPLPDGDRDGLLASIDRDDDGDFLNDGLTRDTDGDGVANFLEYYGYSYDFLTGQFKLWNGDPDTPHYFTDPLQPSTDQDAYPDGMEVSGLLLDPTVAAPGNDPLVAAYPNIVIEVASYSVTLNEDIQITESESLSQGRNWSRQTERTHSNTRELNWGIGVSAGFEAGGSSTGPEGKVTGEVSANVGGSFGETHSTSTSRAIGESITSDTSWSEARSSNPTNAAHLKLFLKVHNRGTAPISNMLPTLTMKIGGLNVATFEPANSQVNMLVPGASYPAEAGVFWVVDSALKGGSAVALSLTLNELRALERGAPLSVSLTQVEGDSMRLTTDSRWESVGDTTEYVARCDAVCANLRIDLGNGDLVHHLVYAGDGPSAPRMTLGRALGKMGVDSRGVLAYQDADGAPRVRSLDGFRYAVDPATLRANGWQLVLDGAPADAAPDGFEIANLLLQPSSNIVIRAPRDPAEVPGLELHFAYLDPISGEIKVSVADYRGIRSVTVYNEDETVALELSEDAPGAGFYGGTATAASGFDASEPLHVVITNLDGETIDPAPLLGTLYQASEPVAPEIREISLDLDERFLYVNSISGNPNNAASQITWVRVYHPDLKTVSNPGYLDLEPVIDFFRDPDGWSVDLPVGFNAKTDVEIVSYASPGLWSSEFVSPDQTTNSTVLRQGAITMKTEYKSGFPPHTYRIGRATLDGPPGSTVYRYTTVAPNTVPGAPVDLVLDLDLSQIGLIVNLRSRMHFNAEHAYLGKNISLYRSTPKSTLAVQSFIADSPLAVNGAAGLAEGDVYAIRTTAGNIGKIFIENIWKTTEVKLTYNLVTWRVRVRYAIFDK